MKAGACVNRGGKLGGSCGGIVTGAGKATSTKVSLLDHSSCNPSPAQGYHCLGMGKNLLARLGRLFQLSRLLGC